MALLVEIQPGLFLGNKEASLREVLDLYQIDCVLNVAGEKYDCNRGGRVLDELRCSDMTC